jgi:pimeloyl-ACP methyl ester carboxylesterase
MQLQSGFLDVNGARLYYEEMGVGEPLVLLHGFSLDTRCWDGQFPVLARRYRVVRYDFRGFGRSSLPHGGPYSHTGDLRELFDRLRIEEAILMGLSMGGGLAVDFALAYPDAVRALVLVDSALSGYRWSDEESDYYRAVIHRAREDTIESGRQRWMRDPMFAASTARPDVADRFTEMVAGYSGWHWLNRDHAQPLEPPAIERLSEVRAPALVVVGEHDVEDMHGIARTLERGIPGAQRVTLPGAGHLSNMDASEDLNRLVLDFLEERA